MSIQQGDLSAAHFHDQGMAARRDGNDALAFARFARANSLIPRYGPTRDELRKMSAEVLAAIDAGGDYTDRIVATARAVEMDPDDAGKRATLARLLAERRGGPDLTQMCFVFYDGERARAIHGEAYRRAVEFVTLGGVVGDVLEFGVLGGWSARLFAETMRDVFNLNDLHLFDSFEGLPDYESEIDRNSYEIGGRNIWTDKMKFPDAFLAQFGQAHHLHIRDRLSEVIRAERVVLHKGFYSETLKQDLGLKAAIVHFDCDLYQSSIEVFDGLARMDALQDGCVLLFDDWNCNRANPNYGQRRALREFLNRQFRFTASPWFTYGYNGAAYHLHDARV
jgi:hypothetical protein